PPERPVADGEATQPVSREQVQAAWSPTQPIDGQPTVFQPTAALTQPAPPPSAKEHRAAAAATVVMPPPAAARPQVAAPVANVPPKRRVGLVVGLVAALLVVAAAGFALKGRGPGEAASTAAAAS